jgi:hypothetical protein
MVSYFVSMSMFCFVRSFICFLRSLISFFSIRISELQFAGKKNTLDVLLIIILSICLKVPSCSKAYGSWIYNYLCNQFISPLKL